MAIDFQYVTECELRSLKFGSSSDYLELKAPTRLIKELGMSTPK